MARFSAANTQVLGISIDSVHCHRAFAESIGGLNYPLLADANPHGAVTRRYGIWREDRSNGWRAVFIIDTEGMVRWIKVYERGIPDNEELLAELAKL